MKKRALASVAAATCALALGACGSSDSSSSSSSSSSGGDVTAFCDKAKELQQLGSTFQNLQAGDLSGAQAAFQQADDQVKAIDDVAPSAVKSNVDTVVATFDDINAAVQGASSPADLQSSLRPLAADVPKLQAAVTKLRNYSKKNCNT